MADQPKPHIEAVVKFLRTDEGGRMSPVMSGYRGQFYFKGDNWEVVYYFKKDKVAPGETDLCRITFACPEHLLAMSVRSEFEIREGARVIAKGTVTRLFEI